MPIQSSQIFQATDAAELRKSLALAAQWFTEAGDFHRLFEIRKIEARLDLGLPPLPSGNDAEGAIRERLDEKLLAACRETAALWVSAGNLPAAWPYLEPLEDRAWVRALIRQVPIDPNSLDGVVEYALHRGGDPEYGYELVLNYFGTCNAITVFDSISPYLSRPIREGLAAQLVAHFFREWAKNWGLGWNEEQFSESQSIDSVIQKFNAVGPSDDQIRGVPCVDATHLHSVTRIGRVVREPIGLQKLLVLCRYGATLGDAFQYPGRPPFQSHFTDSAIFYQALLGSEVEQAIDHFRRKIEASFGSEDELEVREIVFDWLVRIGRTASACDVVIDYAKDDFGELGIAPELFVTLRGDRESLERLYQHFRERGDVLGGLLSKVAGMQTGPAGA